MISIFLSIKLTTQIHSNVILASGKSSHSLSIYLRHSTTLDYIKDHVRYLRQNFSKMLFKLCKL
ncbi:hypothetical protein X975_22882, partial [Stegodyphus mimosarum]